MEFFGVEPLDSYGVELSLEEELLVGLEGLLAPVLDLGDHFPEAHLASARN